jgi:hypothetical protein
MDAVEQRSGFEVQWGGHAHPHPPRSSDRSWRRRLGHLSLGAPRSSPTRRAQRSVDWKTPGTENVG